MGKFLSTSLIAAITITLLEVTLRLLSVTTPSGDVAIRSLVVKPFHLPVQSAKEQVAEYLAKGNSRIEYDPDLGWTARRSSQSVDGLYHYNASRIRRPDEISVNPKPDVVRIVLLGDSLMHSDDVPYQDSLAALLEAEFKKNGREVEVLNLAMSGYGIDQAVLRYLKEGRPLAPHYVVLGFQAENIKRNLTLSRAIYTRGKDFIPFFKPRFLLENGQLNLIGTPTPPPEMVGTILANYQAWGPSRHDRSYMPADYTMTWWRQSRLLGALESFCTESNKYIYAAREKKTYSPESEAYQLSLALIGYLQGEVQKDGAELMLVHLPMGSSYALEASGEQLTYAALLNELNSKFKTVLPDDDLLKSRVSLQELYTPPHRFHFSGVGNKIIAHTLVRQIATEF